jgi:hypothetical protein
MRASWGKVKPGRYLSPSLIPSVSLASFSASSRDKKGPISPSSFLMSSRQHQSSLNWMSLNTRLGASIGTSEKNSIAQPPTASLTRCAAEQRESLTPRAPTLKEQSLLLKIGMSEQEVTKLLGLPSKADVGQCGENTPRPWTCKTWTYGSAPFYALQAFFGENAGEWRLASWNVGL